MGAEYTPLELLCFIKCAFVLKTDKLIGKAFSLGWITCELRGTRTQETAMPDSNILPEVYPAVLKAGNRYTAGWDLPEKSKAEIEAATRLAEFLGSAS